LGGGSNDSTERRDSLRPRPSRIDRVGGLLRRERLEP
jgi:hypothetical protein